MGGCARAPTAPAAWKRALTLSASAFLRPLWKTAARRRRGASGPAPWSLSNAAAHRHRAKRCIEEVELKQASQADGCCGPLNWAQMSSACLMLVAMPMARCGTEGCPPRGCILARSSRATIELIELMHLIVAQKRSGAVGFAPLRPFRSFSENLVCRREHKRLMIGVAAWRATQTARGLP